MKKDIVLNIIGSLYGTEGSILEEKKVDNLERYISLLLKWNKAKNLIGKNTEEDIWERHILDSAQILKYIDPEKKNIADYGCGAGFPGVVLAILDNQKEVHLIESNSKKTNFLLEVKRQLKLDNIIIHNNRIEDIEAFKVDIITARAFAPLSKLFYFILPYLKKDSLCILLKGCNYKKEIEEAEKEWSFDYNYNQTILKQLDITNISGEEKTGVVLKINNLKELSG